MDRRIILLIHSIRENLWAKIISFCSIWSWKSYGGPEFQKVLTNFDLPYDYKGRAQLEKDIPVEYETIKGYLNKMGIKKEGL